MCVRQFHRPRMYHKGHHCTVDLGCYIPWSWAWSIQSHFQCNLLSKQSIQTTLRQLLDRRILQFHHLLMCRMGRHCTEDWDCYIPWSGAWSMQYHLRQFARCNLHPKQSIRTTHLLLVGKAHFLFLLVLDRAQCMFSVVLYTNLQVHLPSNFQCHSIGSTQLKCNGLLSTCISLSFPFPTARIGKSFFRIFQPESLSFPGTSFRLKKFTKQDFDQIFSKQF